MITNIIYLFSSKVKAQYAQLEKQLPFLVS